MELNSISYLRNIDKSTLQTIADQSSSISEMLGKFGFIPQRKDSRKLINQLIITYGIDLSTMHETFNTKFKKDLLNRSKICNSVDVFKIDKFSCGTTLMRHLKKINVEIKCSKCPIVDTYNGKPISLQIHHIDGNNTNNTIDNLALLCPNCHSQTDSFCGRKNKKSKPLCKCGNEMHRYSKLCRKCSHETEMINGRVKKFNITKDELNEMLETSSMSAIANKYGVSSTAVRKRCIKLGIVRKT